MLDNLLVLVFRKWVLVLCVLNAQCEIFLFCFGVEDNSELLQVTFVVRSVF